MTKSKRRFTNFIYILVTLYLTSITKVQSEDVSRVRKRMVAMCPPGFQKIRTECYHISSYSLTWLEAHFECKNKNGKLAEPTRIQDAAIRKFLLHKYASERDEIYFGGMFDHFAGNWTWGVSGKMINYSSFIGLKNYIKRKSLNYTCSVYTPNRKYRWTPRDCTENHRFLCEHKMPKVSENHRNKVYQRWNITYPNQLANEVVMEVRDDDRRNNSRRVKVISESGEEFYLKKTPRREVRPLFKRPTYSTSTPPENHPSNYLLGDNPTNSNPPIENNEVVKPITKPKKDRARSKFDREMAKQRRLERSRKRAAKKEERQRRLKEKEELRRRKEQEQELNNEKKRLDLQRQKELVDRKLLEERQRTAAIREEEEQISLNEIKRNEEQERHRLEDENEGKRSKRLEMDLEAMKFIPEVITEDSRALEISRLEKQKEIERLNQEIAEKYKREQEEELERLRLVQEKHFKELEERELARRAEEKRIRDEKEKERQKQIKRAEEINKQIELEKEMEEKRIRDEIENRYKLEKEKKKMEEEERKEKERQEMEQREREEIENKRKAEIQKKIDAEKDEVIEREMREKERLEKQRLMKEKLAKMSPELQKKFIAMRRASRLSKKTNEVTNDDKK